MSNKKKGPSKGDKSIDGFKEASLLLAGLDSESRARILNGIAAKDPTLAERLHKSIFSFEQVLALPPAELFKVIKAVPSDLVVLSLRGMDDTVLDKFFKGFSERQGRTIREEMLAQGPRKLSDVRAAQEKITEVATKLHENGEIKIK